jgi:hypothetical protein
MDELTHLNFCDIWPNVISRLCFVDLKQCSQVNKQFYRITKPYFATVIRTIRESIENDFGIQRSVWSKPYWSKSAAVSGSYLLKILTGSSWECDLAIIVDTGDFPHDDDKIAHRARCRRFLSCRCSLVFLQDEYPNLRGCDRINTYSYCGRKLHIVRGFNSPERLISDNFDLGFLKNMFNGSKLTILDMESLLTTSFDERSLSTAKCQT